MQESLSFMEVREGDECVVCIGRARDELGHVSRIHATHPNYIVWSDSKKKIWYEIDYEQISLASAFHAHWNTYQDVMCQSQHNLDEVQLESFLGLLASTLSSALENELSSALEAVKSARHPLAAATDRISKRRYILGVIGTTAVGCSIATAFWLFIDPLHDRFLWILMLAIGGGCIGALLSSTSGRIQDARFDPSASALDGVMNGALRVLYGVCGALVAVVAVRSGIVSSHVITPENEHLVLLLIAMAGGFTERHAASIIRRLSENHDDGSPNRQLGGSDRLAGHSPSASPVPSADPPPMQVPRI